MWRGCGLEFESSLRVGHSVELLRLQPFEHGIDVLFGHCLLAIQMLFQTWKHGPKNPPSVLKEHVKTATESLNREVLEGPKFSIH